jgi:hypothetical protein
MFMHDQYDYDASFVLCCFLLLPVEMSVVDLTLLLLLLLVVLQHVHDRLEGERLVGRELGQNLTVQRDVGLRERRNKGRVPVPILSAPRLGLHDPELPPLSLLPSPVPIGVLPRLLDASDGDCIAVLGASSVALGMLEKVLVLKIENLIRYRNCLVNGSMKSNSILQ